MPPRAGFVLAKILHAEIMNMPSIRQLPVIAIVLGIGGWFLFAGFPAEKKLDAYADEVIASCADDQYRPGCYDLEIPKLMDRGLSMEEAFVVTRIVQSKDDVYTYCHVLGHYLSAKETAKDPSKWKDVVVRAPSGVCSNGAIHGAFQERFRTDALPDAAIDELKKELSGICEARAGWEPTRLEQATCTHALGHLTMYVTEANIEKSLDLCDDIALNRDGYDFRQLCYDGAFMQIFQPLEPDDFALIEGKEIETPEEASVFCSAFSGSRRGSCVSESWPLSLQEIEMPKGVINHCSVLGDEAEISRCHTALFYMLTAIRGLDTAWVYDFCSGVDDGLTGQCFANAASRFIEVDWGNIDEARSICEHASTFGVADQCYEELLLYSTYNFNRGSEAFFELCGALPDTWRKQCLAQ